MNENYLCKCGHKLDKHINNAFSCYGCLEDYIKKQSVKTFRKNLHQLCTNFKLDNLALLEQKYDEQILKQYKRI